MIAKAKTDNEVYGFLIERTAKLLKRHFQQQLRKAEAGITVDQWVILYELYEHEELNQLDIAALTFKHAPTITRLIDSLAKLQLIQKEADTNDRRKYIIRLSRKGREKVQQILPIALSFRKEGREGLSERDMSNLKKILHKISTNLSDQ